MTWSAKQYSAFEAQRTRPVRDLLGALPAQRIGRAVDLGCGPGNSTEALTQRFPDATVIGVDSSSNMIEAARARLPHLQFGLADIGTWNPEETFDLILANASLQWVPDHAGLYPRLLRKLNAGGLLAVQTPDNLDEPAHRILRALTAQAPWADRLAGGALPPRHPADWYYPLLRPYCTNVDIWRTTYHHPLPRGAADVLEWFKGSALRPYLDQLDSVEQAEFMARYQERIAQAYPAMADGTVLLPFPRLFVVAQIGHPV